MSEVVNIQLVEIKGKNSGPHLLVTGGVHGDEFEPMAAVRQLIQLFQSDDSPELSGRLTLIPVVNEPAYQNSHRTASDGKDLARTCPGSEEGTITERIAFKFSQIIESADYYIDLHTGGTTITVLPMAGYVLHSDPEVLDKQRAMAKAFNLPIVWGTSAEHDGRSLSVARDAGIPAIYTEYLGSATCNKDGIRSYYEGCLNVMALLKMIEQNPPVNKVVHVVEDRKTESGHMQLSNPSPMTGFFEPAIQLGDQVHTGDLIGTVCNVLGTEKISVISKANGIILTLKTFSFVPEGEGLSVILEK
jgi:uncharacterized protein